MARINTEPCVNVIDNDDNDDIEDDDDDDDDGINKNDDDDDYDEKNGEALTIICCPASHWSGRNFLDRNTRLRCSFAFSTTAAAAAVGRQQQVPSSSLSLLSPSSSSSSSSSYEVNKDAHSNPMEAVQIHIDLRSKRILSIAEEFMDEPPRELEDAIIRIIEEEEQQQQQQRILENHHSTFHIDIGGSGTRSAANSGDNNNSGDDAYTSINFKVLGHGDTLVLKK